MLRPCSYTAMIDGFVRNGKALESMMCFKNMKKSGSVVNEKSLVSVLTAASRSKDVNFGKSIHGFYLETGRVKCDVFVWSSLVDLYGKHGFYDDAQKVFDEMPKRNVVTWTALINGYVKGRCFEKGILVFEEMLKSGVTPNVVTLSSVLSACARVGDVRRGRRVHCWMVKNFIEVNSRIGTTLIDLYAKCGCLDDARLVFQRVFEKNVYTWTAMINGIAAHGYARDAYDLFWDMLESCVLPNEVTFIAVLSACAHGGLVEEGKRLFWSMKERFDVEPNVDHYACMVDLLGRKGLLEEAMDLIESMPMEPAYAVWGALFGSCVKHKNYELGKYAASRVIKLQPNHSGSYTLLANLHSEKKKWDEAARVRKQMKDQQIVKPQGHCLLEVNGSQNARMHRMFFDMFLWARPDAPRNLMLITKYPINWGQESYDDCNLEYLLADMHETAYNILLTETDTSRLRELPHRCNNFTIWLWNDLCAGGSPVDLVYPPRRPLPPPRRNRRRSNR